MTLHQEGSLLRCGGQLRPGDYTLPGNVSSQYISGLLMALPRLAGDSTLAVTGHMESAGYVAMTEDALHLSGIRFTREGQRLAHPRRPVLPSARAVPGGGRLVQRRLLPVRRGPVPGGMTVEGLSLTSSQGDRAVVDILRAFGAQVTEGDGSVTVRKGALRGVTIDAAPIPDLIPALSAVAAAAKGTTYIENAGRLRLKESDRLKSTAALLSALGGQAEEQEAGLVIRGRARLDGGTADPLERPPHRHGGRRGRLRLPRAGDRDRQPVRGQILPPVLGGLSAAERRTAMSSSYGENLHLTIFGQSHSPAIGVTIEGIPAGEAVDLDALQRFLGRRAPGQNPWSTPRKEGDVPEFLCGLKDGRTCGAPMTAIIRNTNTRSGDYAALARTPRPGHADYTAQVKYFGAQDYAGGGHFSGRLTAPLCIAGGICLQLLERRGHPDHQPHRRHRRGGGRGGARPAPPRTGPSPPSATGGGWRCSRPSPPPGRRGTPWAASWSAPCWVCPPDWGTPCSAAWKTAFPPSCSAYPP